MRRLGKSNFGLTGVFLFSMLIVPFNTAIAESCASSRGDIIDSILSAKNDNGELDKSLDSLLEEFLLDVKKLTETIDKTNFSDEEKYCDYLHDSAEAIYNSIEVNSPVQMSLLISDLHEDVKIKTKALTDQAALFDSPKSAFQKIKISGRKNNTSVDGLSVVILSVALSRGDISKAPKLPGLTPDARTSVLPGLYAIAFFDGDELKGSETKTITYTKESDGYVEVAVNVK